MLALRNASETNASEALRSTSGGPTPPPGPPPRRLAQSGATHKARPEANARAEGGGGQRKGMGKGEPGTQWSAFGQRKGMGKGKGQPKGKEWGKATWGKACGGMGMTGQPGGPPRGGRRWRGHNQRFWPQSSGTQEPSTSASAMSTSVRIEEIGREIYAPSGSVGLDESWGK